METSYFIRFKPLSTSSRADFSGPFVAALVEALNLDSQAVRSKCSARHDAASAKATMIPYLGYERWYFRKRVTYEKGGSYNSSEN